MRLQTKLFLILIMVFLGAFTWVVLRDYQVSKSQAKEDLRQEASNIRALLMATRRTYHHQILESEIPLTDKTLGLLPAHAMNRISADLGNWSDSNFTFNNVSDRPRNPDNQGDEVDLEAMAFFRKNRSTEERFVQFESNEGEPFYHYSRPIWVEKYCLKCHGKREDAPETIQKNYDTAFDYKVGDLRGVMAIRLPGSLLESRAIASVYRSLWSHLLILIVTFGLVYWLLIRFIVRRLKELEHNAQSLADGDDYTPAAITGRDEIDGLSSAFNVMAKKLKERNVAMVEALGRSKVIAAELEVVNVSLVSRADELEQSRLAALNMMQDAEKSRQISEKAERELEVSLLAQQEATRDLLSVNELHQSLFSSRTILEVSDVLAQGLVEKFGAYFARVWLKRRGDICDECQLNDICKVKDACLHLVSSAGHYTSIDGSHRRVPLGSFKIGLIAQGRGKTITNDVNNDERVHDRDWAREHGLQSFAGFPLVSDGEVIGVMAMFSQSKLPQHLLDTLELLTHVSVAAIDNVEQIKDVLQADQVKSEFLANMSHEIRTPMTAILGFSEVVLGNVSNPQNIEGLKTIQRNGEYLLEIINDILDLSKIESGKLEVEHIEFSTCEILSGVISLMRVRSTAKGLPLEVEFDGIVPQHIHSDPTRLRQILINLIGNAIKFTEIGKIRLVTRLLDADTNEPRLQFDVVDSGIGMTEKEIDKLFQPFSQADTSTTRKFGGTGLGLTISRRLAETLGGDIRVRSILGEGSTFSVTVSTGSLEGVRMLADPAEAEGSNTQTKQSAASGDQLDCRILLAEDGPDSQRLISFVLKKAGADVTVVGNGQIALDLALVARDEDNPFDVILMDMQMPVLDGYEATVKLREADYTEPIIALTAHAMTSDRQKCINAGCDDYMTKPIDRKKLISLVAHYTAGQTFRKTNSNPVG